MERKKNKKALSFKIIINKDINLIKILLIKIAQTFNFKNLSTKIMSKILEL